MNKRSLIRILVKSGDQPKWWQTETATTQNGDNRKWG